MAAGGDGIFSPLYQIAMAEYVPSQHSGVGIGVPAVIGVVTIAFAVGFAAFLLLTRRKRA